MIKIFILVGVLSLFEFFAWRIEAQKAELESVKIPLDNYLKGHATGSAEFMREAFHTDGKNSFGLSRGEIYRLYDVAEN